MPGGSEGGAEGGQAGIGVGGSAVGPVLEHEAGIQGEGGAQVMPQAGSAKARNAPSPTAAPGSVPAIPCLPPSPGLPPGR
jgi:hypothetical protein